MKKIKILLKVLFSITVIALLFMTKVDFTAIGNSLAESRIGWIVLGFLLHPIGLYISARRWQILLRAQEIRISLKTLFLSYLVCSFFNQFLPTRVGGDLVRAYDTKLLGYSGSKSFAVVFVERASGIMMLLLFALVASLYRLLMGNFLPIYWAGLITGVGGLASILFLMHPWGKRLVDWGLGLIHFERLREKISLFYATIVSYWDEGKQKEFLWAFFLAFLLQLNVIVYYYFLGRSFRFEEMMSITEYFVIVPLSQVILMIPLFINGIGIREGSWIAFLSTYGVKASAAFAYSIIDFTMTLFFGIVGGIIYAVRR